MPLIVAEVSFVHTGSCGVAALNLKLAMLSTSSTISESDNYAEFYHYTSDDSLETMSTFPRFGHYFNYQTMVKNDPTFFDYLKTRYFLDGTEHAGSSEAWNEAGAHTWKSQVINPENFSGFGLATRQALGTWDKNYALELTQKIWEDVENRMKKTGTNNVIVIQEHIGKLEGLLKHDVFRQFIRDVNGNRGQIVSRLLFISCRLDLSRFKKALSAQFYEDHKEKLRVIDTVSDSDYDIGMSIAVTEKDGLHARQRIDGVGQEDLINDHDTDLLKTRFEDALEGIVYDKKKFPPGPARTV